MSTPRTDRVLAGIVLAGGQSRRMGQDKAMLPWNDGNLLAHMQGLLLHAGAYPVRVSGAYPAFGGVEDTLAGQGPLGGLHSVLRTLPEGDAWVVPVDMPRLDVPLLHRLRDAPPVPCVIFADQPLPMRLRVDAATRAQLDRMLADAQGPRSLHALQAALGVLALDPDEHASARLANCNTPEQWKELAS